MSWIPACPAAELTAGRPRVVKSGNTQVAVFRTASGALRAVDNRCPHEGYPLSTGAVVGETLTCTWHNFKFDLCSGACLMGDEAVRTFPVREREGVVEVEVRPPDRATAAPAAWKSLDEALFKRQQGRVSRDVARLLDLGLGPLEILRFGAAWDADHGEYGPSHALALCADTLEWTGRVEGLDATLPIAEALDMASEAGVRQPLRPRPPALPLPADPGAALRAAVEAEDRETAEGLVRGMVAAGVDLPTLEAWTWPLVAEHFLDFGHALIYQGKLWRLLDGAGPDEVERVLGGHVFGIVNGTREDLLPAWAGWRRRVAALDLGALAAAAAAADPQARLDPALFRAERPSVAFEAVVSGHYTVEAILAALTEAAAETVLRFDLALDTRLDVQEDWLDVTHRLTVVEATRTAWRRQPGPAAWRILLQAVHFVAMAAPILVEPPTPRPGPAEPGALSAAWAAKDTPAALGVAEALLAAGRAADIEDAAMAACMADGAVRPIVVAHLMKTTVAAFAEHRATGSARPVLALCRLLASPVKERRVAQRSFEALRLLREGKPPVRLTG